MSESLMPNLQRIALSDILAHDRLRDVDMSEVEKLKLSIADQGLQAPIVIRPAKVVNPKDKTKFLAQNVEGYVLVSGGHRFHAVRDLGWIDIPAIIVEPATPLEARLLEIDENLYRHELNALDRAIFIKERKDIYEEIYPDSKHGGDRVSKEAQDQKPTIGFCSATAEKIGFSLSTIKDCAKIGGGLSDESIARIKGSWLAKRQGELLHLSACDHATQIKYLDLMLRDENPLQSVSKCKAHFSGRVERSLTPSERRLEKLKTAWQKAEKQEQQAFLLYLSEQGVVVPSLGREAA